MWFWFSLIALVCWSGSDLFSKIGCQDADDKYSHLKMVMAVGLVMGLHAAYEIFINGTEKLLGSGVLGMVEHLLGIAFLHHNAAVHEYHSVGHFSG